MRTQYDRNPRGFGKYLKDLQDARDNNPKAKAVIAKIRQGAGEPTQNPALFAYLEAVLPPNLSTQKEDDYLEVICLFSLHLMHREGKEEGNTKSRFNFGASLRQLKDKLGNGGKSLDLRFNALLNTDREDLYSALRPLVQRLRSDEVEVNYTQLLCDFQKWEKSDQSVQRKWAQQYYRASAPESEETSTAATTLA